MPWNASWPVGSQSVKANKTPGQQNTTFTENTMSVDHYWDEGGDLDGHHKYAQMTMSEVGGTPTNPTLDPEMDLIYFAKQKTALESPAQQDVQPYALNSTSVMQILGIRACAVFSVASSSPYAITTSYSHNILSITRQDEGKYRILFTTNLPSLNYLVLGGGIRRTSSSTNSELLLGVQSSSSVTNVKDVDGVDVLTIAVSGAFHDPLQAWIVCFGG